MKDSYRKRREKDRDLTRSDDPAKKAKMEHEKQKKQQKRAAFMKIVGQMARELAIAKFASPINPLLALALFAYLDSEEGQNFTKDVSAQNMVDGYMAALREGNPNMKEEDQKQALIKLEAGLDGVAKHHTHNGGGGNKITDQDDLKTAIGKVVDQTREIIKDNTGRSDFEKDLGKVFGSENDGLEKQASKSDPNPQKTAMTLGIK